MVPIAKYRSGGTCLRKGIGEAQPLSGCRNHVKCSLSKIPSSPTPSPSSHPPALFPLHTYDRWAPLTCFRKHPDSRSFSTGWGLRDTDEASTEVRESNRKHFKHQPSITQPPLPQVRLQPGPTLPDGSFLPCGPSLHLYSFDVPAPVRAEACGQGTPQFDPAAGVDLVPSRPGLRDAPRERSRGLPAVQGFLPPAASVPSACWNVRILPTAMSIVSSSHPRISCGDVPA